MLMMGPLRVRLINCNDDYIEIRIDITSGFQLAQLVKSLIVV